MTPCMLYKHFYAQKIQKSREKKVFNYSLFAGQKVFPYAEEIFSILSQAFDEAFLSGKMRQVGG